MYLYIVKLTVIASYLFIDYKSACNFHNKSLGRRSMQLTGVARSIIHMMVCGLVISIILLQTMPQLTHIGKQLHQHNHHQHLQILPHHHQQRSPTFPLPHLCFVIGFSFAYLAHNLKINYLSSQQENASNYGLQKLNNKFLNSDIDRIQPVQLSKWGSGHGINLELYTNANRQEPILYLILATTLVQALAIGMQLCKPSALALYIFIIVFKITKNQYKINSTLNSVKYRQLNKIQVLLQKNKNKNINYFLLNTVLFCTSMGIGCIIIFCTFQLIYVILYGFASGYFFIFSVLIIKYQLQNCTHQISHRVLNFAFIKFMVLLSVMLSFSIYKLVEVKYQ